MRVTAKLPFENLNPELEGKEEGFFPKEKKKTEKQEMVSQNIG